MGDIGVPELLIMLAIVIVLFGPGKLAGIGRALGMSIKEFRHSVAEEAPAPSPTRASDTPDGGDPSAPH